MTKHTQLSRRNIHPLFKGIVQLFLVSFCLVVVIGLSHIPSVAQQINQATVREILDSNQVFIQNSRAQLNSVARLGQQVRTGQARAGLRFNTGAVGRLGYNSTLTVGRQCFRLQRGQIVVGGAASGCTGSVRAGVRGTIYTLEVEETEQGQITVLQGEVAVTELNKPNPRTVLLRQGQRLRINLGGIFGDIQQLTQEQIQSLLQGQLFQGFVALLVDEGTISGPGFTNTFLRDALQGVSDPFGNGEDQIPTDQTGNFPARGLDR